MDFESAAVHTVNDSEISLPLPFNNLAPSSPAYAWWGKIFPMHELSPSIRLRHRAWNRRYGWPGAPV